MDNSIKDRKYNNAVVLTHYDLLKHAQKKPLSQLTIHDFRVTPEELFKADIVVFKQGPLYHTLKDREANN